MKTLIQTSKVLILSIAVLTAVSYVQAEWNDPSQGPTGGNTAAPINVSGSNQDKTGGFSAASLLGGIITSPEFCIANDDGSRDCISAWPGGGESVVSENSKTKSFSISNVNSWDPDSANIITNGFDSVSHRIIDGSYGAGAVTFTDPYDDTNYIVICNAKGNGTASSSGGRRWDTAKEPILVDVTNKTVQGFNVSMTSSHITYIDYIKCIVTK